MAHELRCYEYVNRPYAVVRDALCSDLSGILARATNSASHRADRLAASLRVEVGAVEIAANVAIELVGTAEEPTAAPGGGPSTVIRLRWKAVRAAAVFPEMDAELAIYPLSKDETQLDLRGTYEPPLGPLGSMLDAVVGHRIAEASVHRFLAEIAALLSTELGARAG